MIKSLKVLSTVAVAVVALAAAPRAQASDILNVKVPFDFVLAGQPLPSGEYQFVRSDYPGVVQVYSKARGRMLTAVCVAAPTTMPEVGLLFHKHGGQHFLKLIRLGDTTVSLAASQAERRSEAARGGAGGAAAAID
jgi:hypothetical protein